jgi:hypothetical protein
VVLAVAAHVARRHGLPPPVPLTHVFPEAPGADEGDWQELVVRHLGLTEWVRQRFDRELDLLGPHSTDGLRRHGLLWPPLLHGNMPALEAAAAGSLVTGEGGDEILGPQRIAPLVVLARRRVPVSRRLIVQVATAVAPVGVRRASYRRALGHQPGRQYLRPEVRASYDVAVAEELAAVPLRWDHAVRARRQHRAVQTGLLCNLDLLGRQANVQVVHPMLDADFLTALGRYGGIWGFSSRTEALRLLAGDLLPDAVLGRRTKAVFTGGVFTETSRRFARDWNGQGVDPALVEPERLRDEWLGDEPDARSFLLLQQAWLAANTAPTSRPAASAQRPA